ncbi:MAG: zf-HC2 domain-containing protein [Pyrinomonadaceae bacterium]
MNCKDLSEIVDSYLSNELLVETNHDVIRHLESCRDCREMLAERREIRARLKSAIIAADESQIDPQFSVRLREKLRSKGEQPAQSLAGLRFAFAGLAILLLVVLGLVYFAFSGGTKIEQAVTPPEAVPSNTSIPPDGTRVVPAFLVEVSHDAFDDHKDCALAHKLKERPISLEKAARTVDAVNLGFDRDVMDALRERFGNDAKLIKAHYCVINGRYFTHVVVALANRTTSVLLTKQTDAERDSADPMPCGTNGDLSAACFSSGGYAVFVVSNSLESETLQVANTISGAVVRHIAKVRVAA